MTDLRNIGHIKGVAVPRTQQELEMDRMKNQLWGEAGEDGQGSAGLFANPMTNVQQMGLVGGMRVADFGSGSGAYTIAAAHVVGHSGKVYSVEVQKDLLTRVKNNAAKEGLDNIDIIWGNFEELGGSKLKDASIDVVIISNVLFQLDHPVNALREAARVLKQYGRIFVIDWSESFGGMGPKPSDVITKEKALEFANQAGLSLLREFKAGAHHYGIILNTGSVAPRS